MGCLHDPFAEDVSDVELVAVALPGPGGVISGREGLDRYVPDLLGGDLDGFLLGVAQRTEPAAEDAAGVQAQGVVDPLQLRCGGVAVEHHRAAAVVLGPRVAHRQAELVGLAGGVAIQREAAHPA